MVDWTIYKNSFWPRVTVIPKLAISNTQTVSPIELNNNKKS
jgi:hypothetical protein